MIVVRSTSQRKILDRRRAAERKRNNVVELQAAGLGAASVRTNKPAPAFVTLPDFPPDRCGKMPRSGRGRRAGVPRPRPGALGRRDFRLLELIHEQREGPIENRRRIAIRIRVPQEILRAFELRVCARADGHFQ
jgi:hypothetical protein